MILINKSKIILALHIINIDTVALEKLKKGIFMKLEELFLFLHRLFYSLYS